MEHALDRSTMNPTRHRQNIWEIIIFFSSYEQENVKQYLKPHSKDGVTTTQLQEQQEKQMPEWSNIFSHCIYIVYLLHKSLKYVIAT